MFEHINTELWIIEKKYIFIIENALLNSQYKIYGSNFIYRHETFAGLIEHRKLDESDR